MALLEEGEVEAEDEAEDEAEGEAEEVEGEAREPLEGLPSLIVKDSRRLSKIHFLPRTMILKSSLISLTGNQTAKYPKRNSFRQMKNLRVKNLNRMKKRSLQLVNHTLL